MGARGALAWAGGLWLAGIAEVALGLGFPGPLLVVAVAVGLAEGPVAGLVAALLAAGLSSALGGPPIVVAAVATVLPALLAAWLGRWASRQHLLWSVLLAVAASAAICAAMGAAAHVPVAPLLRFALLRAGHNGLCMLVVYGVYIGASYASRSRAPFRRAWSQS